MFCCIVKEIRIIISPFFLFFTYFYQISMEITVQSQVTISLLYAAHFSVDTWMVLNLSQFLSSSILFARLFRTVSDMPKMMGTNVNSVISLLEKKFLKNLSNILVFNFILSFAETSTINYIFYFLLCAIFQDMANRGSPQLHVFSWSKYILTLYPLFLFCYRFTRTL